MNYALPQSGSSYFPRFPVQVMKLWISVILVCDPIAPQLNVSQLHMKKNTKMAIGVKLEVCLAQYFVVFGTTL